MRPSLKDRYPITPMERYARWARADGAFRSWLRAHWRSSGEILHVAQPSMVVEGGADDWEMWSGMQFPESGDYIAGALPRPHRPRDEPWALHRTQRLGASPNNYRKDRSEGCVTIRRLPALDLDI
ncbi:MAG: hypothetical protein R2844_17050 [Caldilineales bacterium]